jgi:Flp pilus assembly pilin Flp
MRILAVVSRTRSNKCSRGDVESTADPAVTYESDVAPLFREELGQDFGEYALILALIVIVVAAAVSPFGLGLAAAMTTVFENVVALL